MCWRNWVAKSKVWWLNIITSSSEINFLGLQKNSKTLFKVNKLKNISWNFKFDTKLSDSRCDNACWLWTLLFIFNYYIFLYYVCVYIKSVATQYSWYSIATIVKSFKCILWLIELQVIECTVTVKWKIMLDYITLYIIVVIFVGTHNQIIIIWQLLTKYWMYSSS